MDWGNMSERDKIEYAGFLFFNRCGEEDWVDFNCMACTLEESSNVIIEEDSEILGVEY